MFNFEFTGEIDKRIALPYVAKIVYSGKAFHKEFILTNKNRTINGDVLIITGNFTAQDGDILEIKKGDMDVKWYLVDKNQLHEVVDIYFDYTKDYASSKMLDALSYLEGSLSAQNLIYGTYRRKTKVKEINNNYLFTEGKND